MKNILFKNFLFLLLLTIVSCQSQKHSDSIIGNPILQGYYADPSIVEYEGSFYIYATKDPWGGDDLAVFVSNDFVNFEEKSINWPTKEACSSSTSGSAMVWAPDVIQAQDGMFYMYVSVGSEIWAGKSEHPLGPWENALEDNLPLIAYNDFPLVHNIDANCFIDEDGRIYLYWGSGFNWVNGRCMAVELDKDMISFLEEPVDITPPDFFEGVFMIKKNNRYYLMYSDGKAIDHSYKIRYSTAENPLGPWTQGKNSPIIQTSADSTIYGPGHHSVFSYQEQDYILYHRIYPQEEEYVLRQLCVDSLNFDEKGNIKKISGKGIAPF